MRIVSNSEGGDVAGTSSVQDTTNVSKEPSFSFTVNGIEMTHQEEYVICERLAPDEVYLIAKEGNAVLYAVNKSGTLHLRRAVLE